MIMAFILTQFIDGNPTTLEYPPSWQLQTCEVFQAPSSGRRLYIIDEKR